MILSIGVSSVNATGAESDSDDRFNNIPGAGDCWQDGYNDGQNGPFSQSRNDECADKGNQYTRTLYTVVKTLVTQKMFV